MPGPRLTPKQRDLTTDVKNLLSLLCLDPDELGTLDDSSERTTRLQLAKRQLIISAIILDYVLMDEYLSCIMCWHFFGKERGFPELWGTKRFQIFNHQLVEKIYLVQKLDFVKAVHDIPKPVVSDLMALNDLRNAVAHSFFPENRRRKPEWKKKNVLENEGFAAFKKDMFDLKKFFRNRFFKGSPEDIAAKREASPPAPPTTEHVIDADL